MRQMLPSVAHHRCCKKDKTREGTCVERLLCPGCIPMHDLALAQHIPWHRHHAPLPPFQVRHWGTHRCNGWPQHRQLESITHLSIHNCLFAQTVEITHTVHFNLGPQKPNTRWRLEWTVTVRPILLAAVIGVVFISWIEVREDLFWVCF